MFRISARNDCTPTAFVTVRRPPEVGGRLSTISLLLGHASPTTTNRYAKVDLEMKRQAIAKVKPAHAAPARPGARTARSLTGWSPCKPEEM